MPQKYELEITIGGESAALDKEIAKLEKLVALKEALKSQVETISDADLKKLSEFTVKQEKIAAQIKAQQALVQKAEAVEAEANARKDAAATKSLLNEAKLTREIQRRATETQNAAKKNQKAQDLENSAYARLSGELAKAKKAGKDLLASKADLTSADRELIKSTQELDKKLKDIDSTFGDNHRRVGGYKEALNDAAAELGAFGGGLSRIIRSLKLLQEENSKATTGTQKFGNALKFLAAGAVLAAITALVKGFELLKESSSTVGDEFEVFTAQVNAGLLALFNFNITMADASEAAEHYTRALQQQREIQRAYSISIADLSNKIEKQNQIANDTTIGYQERNAALRESIKLTKEKAEKEIQISGLELANSNQAVKDSQKLNADGKASIKLRDEAAKAQIKYDKAVSDGAIDELTSAEKIRQLHADQAIEEINLILKKRESANAGKVILENELKDLRFSLEERRKINKQLLDYNTATTEEELKIFKKGFDIKFDANELLKEQDQKILAEKIKNLKTEQGLHLGDAGVVELSKIIKDAQENQIASNKTILEQTREEEESLRKIADIESQIAIIKAQDKVGDIQKLVDARTKAFEKNNTDILKSENLFNKKLDVQRQSNFDFILANLSAESSAKEELLKLDASIEIQKAIDNGKKVKDEKLTAEEIKKINEKLAIDLQNIEDESFIKEKELNEKKKEEDKKLTQARVNEVVKQTDFIAEKLNAALDEKSKKNLSAIDEDQKAQQEAQSLQESRAERGLSNELVLQQKKAADLEKQKAEQQKKDERREKILSFYNLLSGYAKADAPSALANAARDIAISEAITVLFAEEGGIAGDVKDTAQLRTGRLSKSHGSKGDVLVAMSPTEGILNDKQMSALGGKQGFYNLQSMLDNPINDDVMFEKVPQFIPVAARVNDNLVREIGREFRAAVKEIPIHNSRLDNVGNVINETVDRGMKKTLKIISKRPGFTRG